MNVDDMSEDRANVLAAFCGPAPANVHDLVGRSANVFDHAVAVLGLPRQVHPKYSMVDGKPIPLPDDVTPLTPQQGIEVAALQGRYEAEAEAMVTDKLLTRARPTGGGAEEDWEAPAGIYVLTRSGAAAAWAVYCTAVEAGTRELQQGAMDAFACSVCERLRQGAPCGCPTCRDGTEPVCTRCCGKLRARRPA